MRSVVKICSQGRSDFVGEDRAGVGRVVLLRRQHDELPATEVAAFADEVDRRAAVLEFPNRVVHEAPNFDHGGEGGGRQARSPGLTSVPFPVHVSRSLHRRERRCALKP